MPQMLNLGQPPIKMKLDKRHKRTPNKLPKGEHGLPAPIHGSGLENGVFGKPELWLNRPSLSTPVCSVNSKEQAEAEKGAEKPESKIGTSVLITADSSSVRYPLYCSPAAHTKHTLCICSIGKQPTCSLKCICHHSSTVQATDKLCVCCSCSIMLDLMLDETQLKYM